MEELKKEYAEKEAAFKEKYKEAICNIAELQCVDIGIGYDMLKAIPRGGEYKCEVELDKEELFEDCAELYSISKKINEFGLR